MHGYIRPSLLAVSALVWTAAALPSAVLAAPACGSLSMRLETPLPLDAQQGLYLRETTTDAAIPKPQTVTFSQRMPRCIEVMDTNGVPFSACQYSSSKTQVNEQAHPELALQLKMDIYTPPGALLSAPRPAVLWLHGGMFLRNGRNSADSPQRGRDFAKAGYITAVPNYRLTPYNNIWPGGVLSPDAVRKGAIDDAAEDARNALRYLRANATRLNIDPTRIAVVGDTAGGALALTMAIKADTLDDDVADGPDYPGICSRPDVAFTTGVTAFDRGASPAAELFDAADTPLQLFHAMRDPHTGATWDNEVAATCDLFISGGGVCERVKHARNTHSVILNLSGPYAADMRPFFWEYLRLGQLSPYAAGQR